MDNMNTVFLPCGTMVNKIHGFETLCGQTKVHITFLKFGEYVAIEGDHVATEEMRNAFAETLLNNRYEGPNDRWIPLPNHEYIDYLKSNGFEYSSYCLRRFEEVGRTLISVKATYNGPQNITSAITRGLKLR